MAGTIMNSQALQPRRSNGRRGQTIIMMAAMFVVLLAFMGLVFDGGRLYFEKRRLQTAADAGALGGAHELWRRNDAKIQGAALNDAKLNGYTPSNSTITVSHPPNSGPRSGDNDFVEVVISQDISNYFIRVLNINETTVAARAVAGLVPYNDACVLALDRNAPGAIKTNGNPTLVANCGIMSNSSDPDGLREVGSAIVNGRWIGVSGNYNGDGFTPTPEISVPPLLDPLAHLDPPSYASAPAGLYDSSTKTYSCPSGICSFSSQIKITGGDVTFLAGIYVLHKGLTVTGGNVTGSEVCFYNINASGKDHIDIGGNGLVRLSAPTSGPMKGILFFCDRNAPDKDPGNKIGRGSSGSSFTGALYFPSQHLDWAGNSQASGAWSMVVANTINISGTSDVQQISLPPQGQGPRITKPTLVE